MPLYDYECKCGEVGEYITPMNKNQTCPACGREMKRLMHSRFGIKCGVIDTYYDEGLGRYITSDTHKKQVMREMEVTPKGDTPKTSEAWV